MFTTSLLGPCLGPGESHVIRPRSDPQSTALARVEALGFRREDVRHIPARGELYLGFLPGDLVSVSAPDGAREVDLALSGIYAWPK